MRKRATLSVRIPLFFFLLFFSLYMHAIPIITSFSPLSAKKGQTVTISGSGFDAVPSNNIVYFGIIRATVTGGNTNSLSVTVPSGATYDPISVTVNGFTG